MNSRIKENEQVMELLKAGKRAGWFEDDFESVAHVLQVDLRANEAIRWLRYMNKTHAALRELGQKHMMDAVRYARAFAGRKALQSLQALLADWRHQEDGDLSGSQEAPKRPWFSKEHSVCANLGSADDLGLLSSQAGPLASQSDDVDGGLAADDALGRSEREFTRLFNMGVGVKATGITYEIVDRWLLATLADRYDRFTDLLARELEQRDPAATQASLKKRARSEAKRRLLRTTTGEDYHDYENATQRKRSPSFRYFERRLEKGSRWLALRRKLGMGVFALVDQSEIPMCFLELMQPSITGPWADMVLAMNHRAEPLLLVAGKLVARVLRGDSVGQRLNLDVEDMDECDEANLEQMLQVYNNSQFDADETSTEMEADGSIVRGQASSGDGRESGPGEDDETLVELDETALAGQGPSPKLARKVIKRAADSSTGGFAKKPRKAACRREPGQVAGGDSAEDPVDVNGFDVPDDFFNDSEETMVQRELRQAARSTVRKATNLGSLFVQSSPLSSL
jgi:hypothetical protein